MIASAGVIDSPAQSLCGVEAVVPRTRTVPTSDGFLVHDPLADTSIRVVAHPLFLETISEASPQFNLQIGLFEGRKLVYTVAQALTARWRPRGEDPRVGFASGSSSTPPGSSASP